MKIRFSVFRAVDKHKTSVYGFRRRFSQWTDVPLLGEERLTHFYALTKGEWQNR